MTGIISSRLNMEQNEGARPKHATLLDARMFTDVLIILDPTQGSEKHLLRGISVFFHCFIPLKHVCAHYCAHQA